MKRIFPYQSEVFIKATGTTIKRTSNGVVAFEVTTPYDNSKNYQEPIKKL